jgi:PAS domain S-box-containing protein
MKIPFFSSIRFQITLASALLVATAVGGVVYYIQQGMGEINRTEQFTNARTLLASVKGSVENQYQSILFHKSTILKTKKEELQSVIDTALITLEEYHDLVQRGILTKGKAQELAKEDFRNFRYRNGVGYIWINDTGKPYPRMIMHPTMQSLDGTVLDDPVFNCALGKDENLFKAFVDVTDSAGHGYVDYRWPKPTADGLTEQQPKISFVRLFRPWNWIIGSGLYVDDLDAHVQQRLDAVLDDLNETFGQIRIGQSGYIYIFTGEREMIYHPIYKGRQVINKLINPATGNNILDDLMRAAKTTDGKIEYIWDKPEDKGNFIYKKIAFMTYFAPLDWYIGASFYLDEVEQPTRKLQYKIMLLSFFFITAAVLLALYAANTIAKPLQRIIKVFSAGSMGDHSARLPTTGRDEFGQLANYFNRFMDEIEDSNKQLSLSEKRSRTLFDKTAEARLIIDSNRFTECNEAAVRMLHARTKTDIINLQPSQLSPEFQPDGKNSDQKAEVLIQQAHNQGNIKFFWHHTRLDGEIFPVEVELTSIPYEDRKILHVLWRDLTHQKDIEQQLLQSQKMETVGTLAGGLAHDFNNVLGGIVGVVSLLKFKLSQGPLDGEALAKHLDTMEQAGQRATAMVQQLLALSRKQDMTLVPVDLNVSLKHVRKIAENSFDKSVDLVFTPWHEEAITLADPGQVEQVLLNCCVNGAHAMTIMQPKHEKRGGTLRMSVRMLSDQTLIPRPTAEKNTTEYWVVSIQDSGVGIDNSTQKKIFDPFFSTKEKYQGTGLGLSMVFNIVQDLKGFITVESSPGKGTSFNIFFPVEMGKQMASIPSHSSQIKKLSGEGLILVVDDEELMRDMARNVLHEFGYRTITAENGREGVRLHAKHRKEIRAVILDMAMPVMSGKDAYIQMRKTDPQIKVILASGFLKDERVEEILALGVRGFVQKPYSVNRLMEELNRVTAED